MSLFSEDSALTKIYRNFVYFTLSGSDGVISSTQSPPARDKESEKFGDKTKTPYRGM